MQTSNVAKLSSAKLIELSDISQNEADLINGLSTLEIDAILSAGSKFPKERHAGDKVVRVIF